MEKIFHDARGPLALSGAYEQREKHTVEHMIKVWRYFADPSIAEDNPEYFGFGGRTNLDRWDVVAYVARNMVDRLSE